MQREHLEAWKSWPLSNIDRPLVGCMLYISGAACHKAVPFRASGEDVPAIAKPTNIVKKAV